MRRIAFLLLFGLTIVGCGKKAAVNVPAVDDSAATTQNTTAPVANAGVDGLTLPPIPAEPSAESRYDVALGEAMARLSEGKLREALAALERARSAQATELVEKEIARLQERVRLVNAAERTAEDVRVVLKQGRADEAARLASLALEQYGGSDIGDTFLALKRQADAMTAATQDQAAELRQQADAAAAAKNYRAALAMYEQALAAQPDEVLRQRHENVRTTVAKYDELRGQAAALRRDPAQLDEAVNLYRQAAQVWDTVQVREEIDTCLLALQNRRERVAIADFEVRGGLRPETGHEIAEELVPAFRGRFDVVERQQVNRVFEELRLSAGDLWEGEGARRDLGRLAKARYLVLGSVAPSFGGVSLNGRLVDLASGLVVQTAKVVAPTPAQAMKQLPVLAQLLQMNDAERLNYEKALAAGTCPPVIEAAANVPPPPPVGAPPPPPIIPHAACVPTGPTVRVDDFAGLPPVLPLGSPTLSVALAIEKDHRSRPRVTHLALELGDNFLRRGLYREADAQFRVALALNPGQADIQLRLDRCRPHLPPLPPDPPRLRLAVLDFVTPPGAMAPGTGPWVAENLAPYYAPPYELIDRGTVYWYMGRLGITLRDAIVDPVARAYLAQALDVRFFVVGTVQPTPTGLEVTAHMLDAASGARLDIAQITAHNPHDLKLRLPEIAHWMKTDPQIRLARQREAEAFNLLVAQAEQCITRQQYSDALAHCQQALRMRPGDVRVLAIHADVERRHRSAELSVVRRNDWQQGEIRIAAYRKSQAELFQEAERSRQTAERQAAAVADAERARQQRAAYERLILQARNARGRQQWKEAVQLYDSALGLNRVAETVREREEVQARLDEVNRRNRAEALALRESALRREKDAEIARLRQQVENERRQRELEEQDRRRKQQERDRAEYARLLDNAQKLQNNGRFDEGMAMLLQAQKLVPGPDVDVRLKEMDRRKSAASADAKRLAEARAKAEKAKSTPPVVVAPPPLPKVEPKPQVPPPLPKVPEKPKAPPPLPKAEEKPKAPPPLPKVETKPQVPPPLPKVQEKPKAPLPSPKADEKPKAPPPLPKVEPKPQVPPLLPKAETKPKLPPPLPKAEPKPQVPPPLPKAETKPKAPPLTKATDPTKTPGSKAEKNSKAAPKGPPAEYTSAMQAGAAAERQGKYADAEKQYQRALKSVPADTNAAKRAEYAKQMDAGDKALKGKRKAEAIRAFEAALKAVPNDATANRLLQRARSEK